MLWKLPKLHQVPIAMRRKYKGYQLKQPILAILRVILFSKININEKKFI